MRGLSEPYGSWNTSWALRRKSCKAAASSANTSRPSNRTVPAVGSISRSTRRLTVDLPQPDSPTSARVSPGATEKLTPSTACTVARGRPRSERRTTKWRTRFSTSSSALIRLVPRFRRW